MAYEDLLKDNSVSVDNNKYFLLTINDLDINTSYPIQFRWKYDDGSFGEWSSSKTLTTPGESFPNVPSTLEVEDNTPGYLKITWDGKDGSGNNLVNFDRLDIYIDGSPFDGTKATASLYSAGVKTIVAPAGTYIIAAYAVSKAGTRSAVNTPVTRTVTTVGETIDTPVAPSSTGFSSARVLSGVTVSWDGAYPSAWTGFQAINIYAGTSATLTSGTYTKVGQMTANKVSNTITIPVDGTYVRYDLPVYIHASSVNKNSIESSLVANVTRQSLGARSAIGSDLADTIISNAKLVDDAVTAAKLSTNSVTADKIVSSAITADKIATNAITAGKIKAGEIDVTKLAAGTIAVNNLEAGNINSTSYIRAGSGNTGARVEMSSAAISGGPAAGFYIYNSAGTAVLSAPLSGGLSIVGDGTFSGNLSIGSSNSVFKAEPATGIWLGNTAYSDAPFRVSTNGSIRANSGTIGGWTLANDYLSTTNFKISQADATIYVGNPSAQHIRMSSSELAHYNGGSATGAFTLTASNGTLTMNGKISTGSVIIGKDVSGTNDGIFINSNNYWYDTGSFKVGDSTKYLNWDGTTLSIKGDISGSSGTFNGTISLVDTSGTWFSSPGIDITSKDLFSQNVGASLYAGSLRLSTGTTNSYVTAASGAGGEIAGSLLLGSDSQMHLYGVNSGSGTIYANRSIFLGIGHTQNLRVNYGGLTSIYTDGTIYANSLGVYSGASALVVRQVQAAATGTNSETGFLRVQTSSRRFKKNIEAIQESGYLDILNRLSPVTYNDINENDSDPKAIGLIAEEVSEIQELDQALVPKDVDGSPFAVNYDIVGVLAVLGIKEIISKLEVINQRLDALEG